MNEREKEPSGLPIEEPAELRFALWFTQTGPIFLAPLGVLFGIIIYLRSSGGSVAMAILTPLVIGFLGFLSPILMIFVFPYFWILESLIERKMSLFQSRMIAILGQAGAIGIYAACSKIAD